MSEFQFAALTLTIMTLFAIIFYLLYRVYYLQIQVDQQRHDLQRLNMYVRGGFK